MYNYFGGKSFSASQAKHLIGSGEQNQYTKHIDVGCEFRAGFGQWKYLGMARTKDFPEAARRAKVLSLLEPEHGYFGNRAHQYLEESLFNKIDQEKNPSAYKDPEERRAAFWEERRSEWQQSTHLDEQTFIADRIYRRRESRAVWMRSHALEKLAGRAIDPVRDREEFEKLCEWVRPSIDLITENLEELTENTPIVDWHTIEGRRLIDGEIISPGNRSQEELRAERSQPSVKVIVDGVEVEMFCTIDFARRVGDNLVVDDLKTGKTKESYSYQLGLYGYYLSLMYPGEFEPGQIKFRLMYPSLDRENRYHVESFDAQKLSAIEAETKRKIRQILSHYTPLGTAPASSDEALQSLIDTFPESEALCLWTLSKFKHDGVWPESAPTVRKPYPLEFAKGYGPAHFKPDIPTPSDVLTFMTTNFSPIEMGLGYRSRFPDFQERINNIIEKRRSVAQSVDYEWINQILRMEFCPTLKAIDFLQGFDAGHLRVALAHLATATGVLNTPENCPRCTYYNICDQGRVGYEAFYDEWRNMSEAEQQTKIAKDDERRKQGQLR